MQIAAQVATVANLEQGIFPPFSSVRQKVTAMNVVTGIFLNGDSNKRRYLWSRYLRRQWESILELILLATKLLCQGKAIWGG